jgi:hypothetical protein
LLYFAKLAISKSSATSGLIHPTQGVTFVRCLKSFSLQKLKKNESDAAERNLFGPFDSVWAVSQSGGLKWSGKCWL